MREVAAAIAETQDERHDVPDLNYAASDLREATASEVQDLGLNAFSESSRSE